MKISTITILIMITILLASSVVSIGVGPAQTTIAFEPNLTKEYTIYVYNTENKAFEVYLELEGELEQYLNLESKGETFQESDESKPIMFGVSFPKDIPPGEYGGKIRIVEKPLGQGTIIASLGVLHTITLKVPTHGKYIRENLEEKEDQVILTIKNIGIKEIQELLVESIIYDESNNYNHQDSRTNFKSDEVFNTTITLPTVLGQYEQNINIRFDEASKNITRHFKVGEINIFATSFDILDFKFRQINSIEVNLSSNWNKKVTDVDVEIDIYKENDLVETIIGEALTIKDYKQTNLFWETGNISIGEYKFVVRVTHEGKTLSSRDYLITLEEEITQVKKQSLIPQAIVIIIGLIILFILIIFLFDKEKKQNRKI